MDNRLDNLARTDRPRYRLDFHGFIRVSVIAIAVIIAGILIGMINYTTGDARPHWAGWVPAWLQGLFAVAQVGVTIWVALELNARTRIEYQRDLSKSWQSFNLAILTEPNTRRIVSAAGNKTGEDAASDLELETLMNFRLNQLHQLWSAERAGMIDGDYSAPIWSHFLKKLYNNDNALFLACCCEQNGYDRRFVSDVRERLGCPLSSKS